MKNKNNRRNHRTPASARRRSPRSFPNLRVPSRYGPGNSAAFLLAVAVVLVWVITGPLFNYSDTWQLVINTGTTIVTFLMVFLIQNTQNRDTLAIQLKLSELVLAMKGAENKFAAIEDLTDEELEDLHEECRSRAEMTLRHLEDRASPNRARSRAPPRPARQIAAPDLARRQNLKTSVLGTFFPRFACRKRMRATFNCGEMRHRRATCATRSPLTGIARCVREGAKWCQQLASPRPLRLFVLLRAVRPEAHGSRQFTGVATFYRQELLTGKTACGGRYDPRKFTAAHRTLPFGTRLRVTDPRKRAAA